MKKYDLFTRLKNHKISEERTRREDFLTEVFAFLLENVPLFFEKIINDLFYIKIFDFTRTESCTQIPIDSNSTPDLVLKSSDKKNIVVIENKDTADFTRDQLPRYMKYCSKFDYGKLILLKSKYHNLLIPDEIKDNPDFIMVHWEEIYQFTKNLSENNLSQHDELLIKAFLELLKDYGFDDYVNDSDWLNYDNEEIKQNQDIISNIIKTLDQLVKSEKVQKSVGLIPKSYQPLIETNHGISGSGSSPRPYLAHYLNLIPKGDIKFPFYVSLSTFFIKSDMYKHTPSDYPAICLHYSFYQPMFTMNSQGKDHCKRLLETYNLKYTPEFWNSVAKPLYEKYANKIEYIFNTINDSDAFNNLCRIANREVVSGGNSTLVPIAYTHEIIHSNPQKEDLEKYYLDILEKIIIILNEFNIFNIKDDFYADFFLATEKYIEDDVVS